MFHKRLLKEFQSVKKKLVSVVAAQWIMLIANVVLMLQTATFIERLVRNGMSESDFMNGTIYLILTLGIVLVVRGVMSKWNGKVSFEISKEVKERLRELIFEKLMKLGSTYREYVKTSEAVQISTEGVEQLEIYFGKYMPQFFYSLLAPLTLFVIVGSMSIKVAVVLLLCVPLIPVSIIAVQKFAKKMLAKYWGTYTELGDSFLECLQGLTTLKIYQADERYARKMDDEAEKFRKVTMRVLIMQLNSISIMDLIAYGGAAIGIILSIMEFRSGHIGLGQCFFIIMISAEFFLPLRLLGSFFHIAMNGNAAADKIFRLLEVEESKPGEVMEIRESSISFEHVTFSYNGNKEVLSNLYMKADKGLTAFVGESGCGKSTLVSLIMGEKQSFKGSIKVGTFEIERIDSSTLHKKITRIRHDSYLFAGTIRQNLCMGKEDATEEQMLEVLQKVQLRSFVEQNDGLDMELLEKASNLSGGQKQRLALARALLHDSDIYIFDEATSNVDIESENCIMEVVLELAQSKTVILISHRLINVVNADQIYVMKNGTIVESGTHEKLQKQNGYYAALYNRQMALEQYGSEADCYES